MIWLGNKRGYLSDWVTQQWVRATGCHVSLADNSWLDGPVGETRLIGKDFFTDYAKSHGLNVVRSGARGLIEDFGELSGSSKDLDVVATSVRHFYERTSEYELDAWSEWHGLFRPFGRAFALIFSRRLQQLNIPLSPLDSSKGISSYVLALCDPQTGRAVHTAWVRELHATRNVLYAGSYGVCRVPGFPNPCVKVVFPLPNGNAIVIMRPEAHADGSLSVISAGNAFGDPGFYFVAHAGGGMAWARHVRSMKETITVYPAETATVRADHVLRIWGKEFLRLHYRMRAVGARNGPGHEAH